MSRTLLLPTTIVLLFVFGGCGCRQSAYKELPSPDLQYLVVERETNCGATDPFGTTISVRFDKPRLGMASLGFPSKRVFLADVALTDTTVRWLDDRNLEIVCDDAYCVKYGIAEMVLEWRGVNIHFDVGKAKKGVY